MALSRIYAKSYDHRDRDGDIIPEFDSGTDIHKFKIPSGKEFSHYEIDSVSQLFSSYEVKSVPKRRAKGEQDIKVEWGHSIGGHLRYRLTVFAQDVGAPAQPLRLEFGTPDWEARARAAIDQRLSIDLVFFW